MTTVKTTTKYGGSAAESRDGFKIAATAQITDEQVPVLLGIGLASVLYRGGASVMNEALGVRSNSKSEFNDADASKLQKALTAWAANKEDSPLTGGFQLATEITRHVHGEGAEPKYADEKKIVTRHIEAGDFAQWLVKEVGADAGAKVTAEQYNSNDEVQTMVLKLVKAYKQRRLAGL